MGWRWGGGDESLFKRSRSHDQDGRHATSSPEPKDGLESWFVAFGARVLPSLFK